MTTSTSTDNDHILQALHAIDARTARIERLAKKTYRQTMPQMPWVLAAIAGAAITVAGLMAYPRFPASIRAEIDPRVDVMQNKLYTIGQAFADYTGNVDRSYTLPAGTLTLVSLTPQQSCRWRSALIMAESSGNHQHPGNKYGYFAGYGFGAEALHIVGLTKYPPRAARLGRIPEQKNFLDDASNWLLAGGKDAFLRDNLLQDRAVTVLANTNIADGFAARVLLQTQPEKIAGFASAAHLKGLTAAISWYARGEDSQDANGTNTSDYARMGEESINRRSKLCAEITRQTPEWLKWMEVKQ